MKIKFAYKNEDKLACFSLLKQLIKDLEKKDFLDKLKQKKGYGYKLVFLKDHEKIIAVAGFKFYYSFRFGKYLEIDDFVVDKDKRRNGYGKVLFNWLSKYAEKNNCSSIQLNSRIKLNKAHKFYEKVGMKISHYRFYKKI